MQSVFVIKVILNCFELASSLKVNFENSRIGIEGGNQHMVQHCASILHCVMMKTSLKYLDILVRGCNKRCKFWEEWWIE